MFQPEVETTEQAIAPEAEAEHPKPATWVPSYSVSSQGASPIHTPSVRAAELPEEVELAPAVESEPEAEVEAVPAVEVVESPAEPEPAVEAAASPEIVVEVVEESPAPEAVVEETIEAAEPEIEVTAPEETEVEETTVPVIATEEVDAPEVRNYDHDLADLVLIVSCSRPSSPRLPGCRRTLLALRVQAPCMLPNILPLTPTSRRSRLCPRQQRMWRFPASLHPFLPL